MVCSGRGRRDGRGAGDVAASGAGVRGRALLVVALALLALVVCGLAMRVSHAAASAPEGMRVLVADDAGHVEGTASTDAGGAHAGAHADPDRADRAGPDGHGSAHPGALECLALVALGGVVLAAALLVARARSARADPVRAPAGRSRGAPSTGPPRILALSLHELSISRT